MMDIVENDRQCKGADKEADVESLEAVILTVVVAVPVCKTQVQIKCFDRWQHVLLLILMATHGNWPQ